MVNSGSCGDFLSGGQIPAPAMQDVDFAEALALRPALKWPSMGVLAIQGHISHSSYFELIIINVKHFCKSFVGIFCHFIASLNERDSYQIHNFRCEHQPTPIIFWAAELRNWALFLTKSSIPCTLKSNQVRLILFIRKA